MAMIDYFLKIDGIDGETLDTKNKGAIEVESWSWGAENKATISSASGGAGAGKCSLKEFTFNMKANKASGKLLLACAQGQAFKTAVLFCRVSGKDVEYLKITLGMVFVTSFQASGTRGDDTPPNEEVKLAYGKVQYEYREQKPDGTLGPPVVHGWDMPKNQPISSVMT